MGGIQAIDGASHTVVAAAGGYGGPTDVGVDPTTGRVYLLDGGVFFVHEGVNLGFVTGFSLADFSGQALGVHAASSGIFVPTFGGVQVVSGDLNSVVHTAAPFVNSRGVAVDESTGRIYLTDATDMRLHVIQN